MAYKGLMLSGVSKMPFLGASPRAAATDADLAAVAA
jgi:hypothetical protein